MFSPSGEWLAVVSDENEAYKPDGTFFGYVLDDDRVVRKANETRHGRIARPMRPMRPMRPLRPLRRLRMPRLPHPYEDVFGYLSGNPIAGLAMPNLFHLEGAEIYASDGTFLGTITRNRFDPKSIGNQFGSYGSRYNSTSILNQYGSYGSQYSALSPFNRYTNSPPRIVLNGRLMAYLTINPYLSPRVDPQELLAWIEH